MKHTHTRTGRHFLGGTLWVLLAESVKVPTGLITTIFLIRKLGPDGFGAFALSVAVVTWIEVAVNGVFGWTTVKFIGSNEHWEPIATKIFRANIVISTSAMVLLWIMAPYIAEVLNEPSLSGYLRLFSLDIPIFTISRFHRRVLVGLGHFRERALATAGHWVSKLLIIVILVELGLSVEGAILGSIGASVAELIIGRYYIRPSFFKHTDYPLQNLWSYAAPLFLLALSLRFYDKLDLLMLKGLGATTAMAGIYAVAQNFTLFPRLLSVSVTPVLLSTLSRLLRTEKMDTAKLLASKALRIPILLVPFAALTAGCSEEIIRLLIGTQYIESAHLFSVLIFSAVAMLIISECIAILIARGRPGLTFAILGPFIPLAFAGYFIFIPKYGAMGAAVTASSLSIAAAILILIAVYAVWQITVPFSTFIRSMFISVFAFFLAYYLNTDGILVILKMLILSAIVVLIYIATKEFDEQEIKTIRELIVLKIWPNHKQ